MLDKLSDSASRGSVGFGVLSAGLLGAQAAFRGFNGAVDDSPRSRDAEISAKHCLMAASVFSGSCWQFIAHEDRGFS